MVVLLARRLLLPHFKPEFLETTRKGKFSRAHESAIEFAPTMDHSGMSMSMDPSSTMNMNMGASATSTGMAMATETGMDMSMGGDSMSGMDMSGMTMDMSQMLMTFFTSTVTPLYSKAWTPDSSGQYAGTCIFLIILPIIFRALIAARSNFPGLLASFAARNDTGILREHPDTHDWKFDHVPHRPWRVNEALLRAVLDTLLAGVSYLM